MTREDAIEEALDALLARVRWYQSRRHRFPLRVALAFNRLCDETNKPNDRPWTRIRLDEMATFEER